MSLSDHVERLPSYAKSLQAYRTRLMKNNEQWTNNITSPIHSDMAPLTVKRQLQINLSKRWERKVCVFVTNTPNVLWTKSLSVVGSSFGTSSVSYGLV